MSNHSCVYSYTNWAVERSWECYEISGPANSIPSHPFKRDGNSVSFEFPHFSLFVSGRGILPLIRHDVNSDTVPQHLSFASVFPRVNLSVMNAPDAPTKTLSGVISLPVGRTTLDANSIGDEKDDGLMYRLQGGDRTAFEQLVERHQTPLAHFFFRHLRDWQLAEDLTQETLIRVHNTACLPRGCFKGWMFRIARNLMIDSTRRRSHDARQCNTFPASSRR